MTLAGGPRLSSTQAPCFRWFVRLSSLSVLLGQCTTGCDAVS